MNDNIFESKWCKELQQAIMEYCDAPCSDTCSAVISLILKGIRNQETASFPAQLTEARSEVLPGFELAALINNETGEKAAVMLTENDKRYDLIVSMNLRRAVEKMLKEDDIEYLVINPWSEYIFEVKRELLEEAMHMLNISGEERCETHKQKRNINAETVYRIETLRPMKRQSFKYASSLIKSLSENGDTAVNIEFGNYIGEDMIDSILIEKCGNEYHMEIVNNMDEFGWNEPLVLANDVDLNTVLKLLKSLALNDEQSGDIDEIINGFKSL